MPRKRNGYTQVPLEFPDELLDAIREARGELPLTTWVCQVCAAAAGVVYTAPKRGRPVKNKPSAKRRGRK